MKPIATKKEYLENQKPNPKKLVRPLHAALDKESVGCLTTAVWSGHG